MAHFMRVRFWERKIKAVEYKGGSCKACGYNKCIDSMVFHHRDPNEKEFDWNRVKRMSWTTVLKELDKCDLFCCRCHTEVHYNDRPLINESIKWLKENKVVRSNQNKIEYCKQCGSEFKLTSHNRCAIYCSKECVRLSQIKVNISDSELIRLVESSSKCKVAKEFGVSDRAIAKRYKRAKLICQNKK